MAQPKVGGCGHDMGECRQMGKQNGYCGSFLKRLAKSQAGNTLAIVAAAIIPLMGLIGGGVDMSRAYMVRSRLQQACDAAALAGRRSMTTASMTDTDKTEARRFFDFNFPQGTFGSTSFTPTIQSNPSETTTVQVSATTSVPTTIMRVFGKTSMEIAVDCNSRFDIGNTDVMLVLDTTGSMDSSISNGTGGTTTRIAALRQAVRDFYDTLGAGNNSTGRIRYGFVPYSSTVNVGKLIPSQYLVGGTSGDNWTYNSRQMTYYSDTASTTSTCYRGYRGSGSNSCRSSETTAYSDASSTDRATCQSWGNATTSVSGSYPGTVTKITYSAYSWNNTTPFPSSGSGSQKCVRKEVTTTHSTNVTGGTGNTSLNAWSYDNVTLDTYNFARGNAMDNPAFNDGTQTTWAGCIEEAQTDATITTSTSTSSIPTGAYDLDPDLKPDTRAKRWKPFWPDASWYRSSTPATAPVWSSWPNDDYAVCVARARTLATYTSRTAGPSENYGTADTTLSNYDDYVTSLNAGGFTNHTVGITWGARMLSPDGIFGSMNGTAPNGFATSKNIVFMTDGAMQVPNNNYDAWGINALNGRVSSTGKTSDELKAIQEQRFKIACEAAKRKGITIWIVVFASSSNSSLNACATSTNHIAVSTNASSLSDDFKNIAKNIGGLRLSQ